MALRYLDRQEQQYVPTYTALDPQIVSGTHQQIQNQVEKSQQYKRDTFDVAAENVASTLSNLDQRDQQYAREQFAQSRQNLKQIMKEQGSRNLMPFVDEEVNRLTTELQPLKNVAQIKQQAVEQLSENENVPTEVKNSILQGQIGGVYDEQGNLVEAKADINENDLSVAANWEDMNEFMSDFNSKARKANIEEGRFDAQGGGFATQAQSGEVNDYRRIVEALNGDQLMFNNMEALLSNPKMREQLGLLAKIRLNQDNPNITVDNEGKVHETLYVPKTNSQGDYVDEKNKVVDDFREADVEKKQQTYTSAVQWQATQLAKPYAERDSYYRSKYETQKATGQRSTSEDMSESNIYTSKISWKNSEMPANEYFSDLSKQVDSLEHNNESTMGSLSTSLQEFYKTQDNIGVAFEEGEAQIKVGNDNVPKDELISEFDNRISQAGSQSEKARLQRQKNKVLNRVAILESNEAQANAIQKQIRSINHAVKNSIKGMPEFSGVANAIQFSDAGEVSIDEKKFSQLQKNNALQMEPKSLEGKRFSTTEDSIEGKISAEDIRENEVFTGYVEGPSGPMAGSRKKAIITRKNGELIYYPTESGKMYNAIDKAKKLQQEYVNKIRDAGEIKNVRGVQLNPENKVHEGVISMFEHQPISPKSADGEFINGNNKTLTEDDFSSTNGDRFVPTKVAMVNGEPVLAGYGQNNDKVVKEDMENVQLRGQLAESIARDIYGADYHNVISAESLKSFLPELLNGSGEVQVSETVLNNLLGTDFKNDFKITYKSVEDNQGEYDSFRLLDHNGNEIAESRDTYGIITRLLSHYESGGR